MPAGHEERGGRLLLGGAVSMLWYVIFMVLQTYFHNNQERGKERSRDHGEAVVYFGRFGGGKQEWCLDQVHVKFVAADNLCGGSHHVPKEVPRNGPYA